MIVITSSPLAAAGLTLAVFQAVAISWVVRRAWPDMPGAAGYTVIVLNSAVLAAVELDLVRRAMGRTNLILDFASGWKMLLLVFGLAYALAIGLFIQEWREKPPTSNTAARAKRPGRNTLTRRGG